MMRPFRGVRKTENLSTAAVAAAVSAIVAAGGCVNSWRAADGGAGRPIEVRGEGYASSGTCRTCHPSQYASWHASYHRTMTQIATPQTVATSFDGVTVDAIAGEPIRLEQQGQQLFAAFADPDDRSLARARLEPGTSQARVRPQRIKRQVVMTTGSHNQQI
jgi:hypothetical protein